MGPAGDLTSLVAATANLAVGSAVVIGAMRGRSIAGAAVRRVPLAASPHLWLIARGFRWTGHVFDHGLSLREIARTVATGRTFRYLHDGICKLGYWDAARRVFVATDSLGFIFTAF
jgi:hypothetical protein